MFKKAKPIVIKGWEYHEQRKRKIKIRTYKWRALFVVALFCVLGPLFLPEPVKPIQVNKDSTITFQHEASGQIYSFHLSEIFNCTLIEREEGMWCE